MPKEIKVGLFGLLAILVFVLGFRFLKGTSFFKGQNTYYAEYNTVDGLYEKNPVMLNGVNIGLVNEINFKNDNSGKVILTLSIDDNIKLPINSVASVASNDLLGNKVVKIALGDATEYASDNDLIIGGTQTDITTTVQREIAPIKLKFEEILGSVDSVLIIVRQIFNDKNLNNLDRSFNTIPSTLNNFNKTSDEVSKLVQQQSLRINNILANAESISANFKGNNQKITNILTKAETATDKLSKIELENTINQANEAITALKESIAKLNSTEGSLGLMMNDKSLYQNLEKSSADLDKLLVDLKANPKKYVHFSIFSRKDKKGDIVIDEKQP